MSESEDEKPPQSDIAWIAPERGICDVYSNIAHVNWTGYDIRIRFGRLTVTSGEPPSKARWVVKEEAAVSMPYPQVKYLRNLLHGLIKDYEAKNGEIKIAPEWPEPTAAVEPKNGEK